MVVVDRKPFLTFRRRQTPAQPMKIFSLDARTVDSRKTFPTDTARAYYAAIKKTCLVKWGVCSGWNRAFSVFI